MAERRSKLSLTEVAERSRSICARLIELCASAQTVALFAAIENEVRLDGLAQALRAKGPSIAYPRVEAGRRLAFCAVAEEATLRPSGAYRIPEPPADGPEIPPASMDVVVVPGLAFDFEGDRVGWGAGFYDAFLPRATNARHVGVCYDFQLVSDCPREPSDVPVGCVVTETRMVTISPSAKRSVQVDP